jgi:hypothetical protein
MKRVTWIALASFLSLALPLCAAETAQPPITNVGFMENPPKELKEKFPMCDAFLKVEWIDKEKKVGYSEYEFYNQGKKSAA